MSGEDRGETVWRKLVQLDDFGSDLDDGGDDDADDELSVGANVFSTQTIYSAVVTDIFGNRNDRPGDEPTEEVENPGGEVEVAFRQKRNNHFRQSNSLVALVSVPRLPKFCRAFVPTAPPTIRCHCHVRRRPR